MLHFTNTLSGKKESLEKDKNSIISLYVCGITPYDYAHIGHGRCYVTFDLLYRLLQFLGYKVTYCRNFTDIDDKILNKAQIECNDINAYKSIAEKYILSFTNDMQQLNCLTPNKQPRVTETIPQIISFIQGLIEKKTAYERNGSVYFRVASFRNYGNLSKQNIKELQSGARIQIDESKENPLDFALWKSDEKVGFNSPWGQGRPGWHIECSAMIQDTFSDTIDIHGGGMDLIFPHHENEIAQSESLYQRPLSKCWIHNAFVQINKEKMSKSLGNFFTLQDIFKDFDPMVIRYYFLKHHYRNPLEFSFDDIQSSQKAYKKIISTFQDVSITSVDKNLVMNHDIIQTMIQHLKDDLNTSAMFGVLFEKLPILENNAQSKALIKYFLVQVLGLTLKPIAEKQQSITPEIQHLLEERDKARAEKNWSKADEIRNKLQSLGFNIHDKKTS